MLWRDPYASRYKDSDYQAYPADTVLHIAIQNRNRRKAIQLIRQRVVDLDAIDNGDHTALLLAVQQGDCKLVRELIAAGADVNKGVPEQITPLMAAAGGHTSDSIKVAHGYPLKRSYLRDTVYDEILKMLLEAGADPSIVSRAGFTAMDNARFYKRSSAIRILNQWDVKQASGDGLRN